jgi:peptide/nickel transport system permease protein
MRTFILRRLLSLIPILLGVTFITFLIIQLTPGDFLATMSMDPQVSPERIELLRHNFGLDRPWYVQYGLWVYRLSPFQWPFGLKWPDLGYSFKNKTPVMSLMGQRFRNTLLLTVTAEVLTWLIAIPMGAVAAMKRGKWIDRVFSLTAFGGISVPEIMLALLAMLFAATTGWFPLGGMRQLHFEQLSFWQQAADLAHHLALPVLVLTVTSVASLMRYMRGSLLETLTSDYIRTARAKGLSWNRAVFKHAFRNAINPMITLFGFSFANLIGNSFLVEVIMGWPGVGQLTYEALITKDLYVVMASLMVTTTFLIVGNLMADLMLAANDPRIRYE